MTYKPSEKKRRIISLIAAGYDEKEASATIGISYKTFRGHVSSLFKHTRLKRRTRPALVTWAIQQNVIDANDIGLETVDN